MMSLDLLSAESDGVCFCCVCLEVSSSITFKTSGFVGSIVSPRGIWGGSRDKEGETCGAMAGDCCCCWSSSACFGCCSASVGTSVT